MAQGGYGATVGYAPDALAMAQVDSLLNSPIAKSILPSDLKLRWAVKADVRTDANGKETNIGYAL